MGGYTAEMRLEPINETSVNEDLLIMRSRLIDLGIDRVDPKKLLVTAKMARLVSTQAGTRVSHRPMETEHYGHHVGASHLAELAW